MKKFILRMWEWNAKYKAQFEVEPFIPNVRENGEPTQEMTSTDAAIILTGAATVVYACLLVV